jgi:membrane-associated protease RseP (regulator of RpoE activity)
MTNLVASRPRAAGSAPPPNPRMSTQSLVIGAVALAVLLVWAVVQGGGYYVLGFVGFVLALLVSVTLHEGGHFWTARRYGMKATQFFVGFGPTIWSRQRGETEWGVKAIPAGGFVKIVGMTSLEEVEPGDEDRVFWKQPARQRGVVLAAGSVVHFILAILIILASSLVIGKAVERAPGLGMVAECVPAALELSCDDAGAIASPAAAAGLQAGDTVLAVDGEPVGGVLDFVERVRQSPGEPVTLTVERDGAQRELSLTPAPVLRPSLEDPDVTARVGAIGVQLERRFGTDQLGPVEAVEQSGVLMIETVKGIWTTFTEKLDTITQVYGPDRDPQGFVGVVGAGRISGEVLASDETFAFKVLNFLLLIAGLNFFVGVFNLLPLLPLDGGHLAVLAYEQGRHKVKQVFGYTGPLRRVDLTKLLPLTYAVVVLFAGFTVFLLGADIVNPIRLEP